MAANARMSRPCKIIEIATIEGTLHSLLAPLLNRLSDAGYEVHVACSRPPGGTSHIGFPLHAIHLTRRLFSPYHLVALVELFRLFRRERFDVVHVHTPVASAIGRLAARLAGMPRIVYTAHGFYFHDRMPRLQRQLIVATERFLGRQCTDLILTQSREDMDAAVREGIVRRADDVLWIGNGVDTEQFRPIHDVSMRQDFGFDAGDRVVGFVGRLVREKGLVELVHAISRVHEVLPDVRLLLIGKALDSDRDVDTLGALREIVEEKRLQGVVHFAGFRRDIDRLLRGMDLFVMPSHREGMPRSILEAMASGLPVVATNIRGCREEVVDGVTGLLVPVQSPERLAEAITRILTDASLRLRMGEAGRRRAEELFREEAVLDRQIEALDTLLAAESHRGRRRAPAGAHR